MKNFKNIKKRSKKFQQSKNNKNYTTIKSEQGITLKILIIIIAIAIITTGVSIVILTKEKGQSNKVQEEENKNYQETEIFEKSSTINGKEASATNPIVPAGFKTVETENAKWKNGTDEPQAENGLVIEDIDHNQFVWVPVPDINDFKLIEGYYYHALDSKLQNCKEPNENGYATEVEEYEEMKKSVEKYKGFYIGRYEAGKGNNGEVVVQKNKPVYNIAWSNSDDMNIETGGAVEKAKNFKKGKAWEKVATSTLIYGTQWDATMQFFDNNYVKNTCNANSYVRNSEGKGYYSDNLINTGSNENYAVKNIYDMAGNAWEWTMETQNDEYRTSRGGNFNEDSDTAYPASYRNAHRPSHQKDMMGYMMGFRISIYIKVEE